jgi:multidrug efflux pump subunit AcrA (membrane-fusion protein)
VVAGFAEADATRIAVGQPAAVTLSALTGAPVNGKVTAVSPVSTVVSNVVTYGVTVTLTNPPSDVKAGMTANVAVTVSSVANTLELPTSAITTTGRFSTVSVLKDGKQTSQAVTTGTVGDTSTQITSGLSAGQVVVEPSASASSTGSGGTAGSTGRTGTGGGFFGGAGGFGGGFGGGGFGGGITGGGGRGG